MKLKVYDIECKDCRESFDVEVDEWAFSVEVYESGCDCCSDETKINVWVKCPDCGCSFDKEIV
jgi:transcription elongation factor Elf1